MPGFIPSIFSAALNSLSIYLSFLNLPIKVFKSDSVHSEISDLLLLNIVLRKSPSSAGSEFK